jgi:hypothetical protein
MKKQLIIASAALMLGTFGCQKNETTPPLKNQGIEANQSSNIVNQKMFEMTTEQTSLFVKTLKSKLSSTQSRLSQYSVSTTKDTALWEIEALLNSDFDKSQITTPSDSETLECTLTINNTNGVDFTEITNAYTSLSNQINQHLSTNINDKVKLIDITATESDNFIYVKAYVIYTTDNSNHKTNTNPCSSITISGHFASAPGSSGALVTCSTEPNHGPSMCNTRLNCSQLTCDVSGYYTNIVTISDGVNSNSNPYYSQTPITTSCDAYYLSAYNLNSNVTKAQVYGASNLPTSPTGMSIINYNFLCQMGPAYPGAVAYRGYWQLKVTYGVLVCTE